MKKRMKKVATLCLAGVTAMSTVGVTGSAVFAKGDTNYDVDNMDFENVELRVAFRFNNGSDTDGQAKWYYKALEEFNKENEGKIHVTDESISTESDYEEKLTTDFASGNVPNAFLQYGGSRTREYVDAGYILDLTPYFEQYPEWKEGVQDFAWETTQFDGIEGTYGIPWSAYQLCLYYNKDYLDQVGVDVPESWDDLVDACAKLKDAGITPMTMDDAYATCVIGYHLARLVGEDKVKEIVTEGEWDDPAVLQMAQDIEELASNGYYSEMVGSNVWPAGQNTELALGTAAMYLNGSWLPNEVKEMAGPDFHWGCFAYPALTDGANGIETNNFGAQVFGINKDTKLAKEAFDLITFLTKGEYDQKLADETVGIPADTTNTEWPAMVECAKPVIEQSTNRFTWACGVESNVDMTPVIKENFIKLMAGSITADEFVSSMQDAAK